MMETLVTMKTENCLMHPEEDLQRSVGKREIPQRLLLGLLQFLRKRMRRMSQSVKKENTGSNGHK